MEFDWVFVNPFHAPGFSGSLYALSLSGEKWLGAVAPAGGLALLGGWTWFTTSVWGVSAGDLNRGLCHLARPALQFTTSDGDPIGRDTRPITTAADLRRQTVLVLEEMGIPVEHAQHEDAPSQHEIDLRYTDALTMGDSIMTYRLIVKEIAVTRAKSEDKIQAEIEQIFDPN